MRQFHRAARRTVFAAMLAQWFALPVQDATAQAPIWVQLPPPASVGLHVRDSHRDRELFFDETGLLAVADAPVTEWQRIWTGVHPASSANDFAFYDPARDRIWTVSQTFSDTLDLWYMDLSVDPLEWTQQPYGWATPGLQDTVVQYRTFAFDPIRDRVVFFGGYASCSGCLSDFTNAVYALTLSGTPQWTHETVNGLGPGPRSNSAMVYDPWRDRMLVYGGLSFGPNYYDETWALSLGASMSWSLLNPTQLPPPGRSPGTTLLDSLGRRWFVMGFSGAGGVGGGQTYSLDLSPSVPAKRPEQIGFESIETVEVPEGHRWERQTLFDALATGALPVYDSFELEPDIGPRRVQVPLDRIAFLTYRSSRQRDVQMLVGVIVGIGAVVVVVALAAREVRREQAQCASTAAAYSRHAEMLEALASPEIPRGRHRPRRRH